METKSYWIDELGKCHCESCGRVVEKENLFFEKHLGYCKECYEEIQEYENRFTLEKGNEKIYHLYH
jgi:hypothetical protein